RRVRVAGDALVDGAVLVRLAHGLRVRAEDVGRGGRLDRGRHVEVRSRRQVDRRGEVEAQVDVRVHVDQGHDLLVRQRDGLLGLHLVHRDGLLPAVLTLVAHSCLLVAIRERTRSRRLRLRAGYERAGRNTGSTATSPGGYDRTNLRSAGVSISTSSGVVGWPLSLSPM